eukprot:scaffold41634_cov16-Prasinocladus_malaysianus.AAC.1
MDRSMDLVSRNFAQGQADHWYLLKVSEGCMSSLDRLDRSRCKMPFFMKMKMKMKLDYNFRTPEGCRCCYKGLSLAAHARMQEDARSLFNLAIYAYAFDYCCSTWSLRQPPCIHCHRNRQASSSRVDTTRFIMPVKKRGLTTCRNSQRRLGSSSRHPKGQRSDVFVPAPQCVSQKYPQPASLRKLPPLKKCMLKDAFSATIPMVCCARPCLLKLDRLHIINYALLYLIMHLVRPASVNYVCARRPVSTGRKMMAGKARYTLFIGAKSRYIHFGIYRFVSLQTLLSAVLTKKFHDGGILLLDPEPERMIWGL